MSKAGKAMNSVHIHRLSSDRWKRMERSMQKYHYYITLLFPSTDETFSENKQCQIPELNFSSFAFSGQFLMPNCNIKLNILVNCMKTDIFRCLNRPTPNRCFKCIRLILVDILGTDILSCPIKCQPHMLQNRHFWMSLLGSDWYIWHGHLQWLNRSTIFVTWLVTLLTFLDLSFNEGMELFFLKFYPIPSSKFDDLSSIAIKKGCCPPLLLYAENSIQFC